MSRRSWRIAKPSLARPIVTTEIDVVAYRGDCDRRRKIIVCAEKCLKKSASSALGSPKSRRPIRDVLRHSERAGWVINGVYEGKFGLKLDELRLLRLTAVIPAIDVELEAQSIRGAPVEDRARAAILFCLPLVSCRVWLCCQPSALSVTLNAKSGKQGTAERPADEAVDPGRRCTYRS